MKTQLSTRSARSARLTQLTHLTAAVTLCLAVSSPAQVARPDALSAASSSASLVAAPQVPIVTERGPHSRNWSRLQWSTNHSGEVTVRTNLAYVELATGMHYRDPQTGAWSESQELIEGVPGGAIARHGQHQAAFPNDLGASPVQLSAPDGRQFSSRILGLSYFDASTGTNLLIAPLKSCQGSIVGSNQVVYDDCLDGLKATVRYTYTKAGFEQDIILLEAPPSPSLYGLNPQTTRLTALTEFINPVQPAREVCVITNRSGSQFTDESLDFGAMRIGTGRGFLLGRAAVGDLPMYKQWMNMEGRYFLIEQVPVPELMRAIATLPKNQGAALKPATDATKVMASKPRPLPKMAASSRKAMQTASVPPLNQGLVLDYQQINSGQSGFTFQADQTYYISAAVIFSGITTFEGGTVLKFSNAPTKISLSSITCKTGPYRMAYLTSKNDDSIGQQISDSNHQPTSASGATFLAPSDTAIHYMRFSYAGTALYGKSLSDIYHCQFVNCAKGVDFTSHPIEGDFYNVLFAGCQTALANANIDIHAEHVTADNCLFNDDYFYNCTIINGVFTACTFTGTPTFDHCVNASTSTGYYQTVGAGNYYLADTDLVKNNVRNAGSTSITCLADIRKKTTYPPLFFTGTISSDTTLSPQAQRDTDAPDIGYHYDPIDYIVNGVSLSARLILTNGVVLANYGGSATSGLQIGSGGRLLSAGLAQSLNWLVRYSNVQEQWKSDWSSGTVAYLVSGAGSEVTCRFTGFSLPSGLGYHLWAEYGSALVSLINCQFTGGKFDVVGQPAALTNNLWERVALDLSDDSCDVNRYVYNNLFRVGSVHLQESGYGTRIMRDNFFDQAVIYQDGTWTEEDYNGYVTGFNRLSPNQTTDKVISAAGYLTGKLGIYYYNLTPMGTLIDADDTRSPATAGLFQYTVKAIANSKEGTDSYPTKLDLGFHYVGTDSNGNPLDYDGDGIPDYIEDAKGDGDPNGNPKAWQTYNSPNGLTSGSALQVFTPLR